MAILDISLLQIRSDVKAKHTRVTKRTMIGMLSPQCEYSKTTQSHLISQSSLNFVNLFAHITYNNIIIIFYSVFHYTVSNWDVVAKVKNPSYSCSEGVNEFFIGKAHALTKIL